jgi:hypothetical protein
MRAGEEDEEKGSSTCLLWMRLLVKLMDEDKGSWTERLRSRLQLGSHLLEKGAWSLIYPLFARGLLMKG